MEDTAVTAQPKEEEVAVSDDDAKKQAKRKTTKRRGWSSRSRRQKKRSKQEDSEHVDGIAVSAEDGDTYWEIEKIISFKKRKGKPHLFCVKWKGSDELTWEPEENLCDTALADAMQLVCQDAERKLGITDDTLTDEDAEEDQKVPAVDDEGKNDDQRGMLGDENSRNSTVQEEPHVQDDDLFDWTDEGQIRCRKIERIHVDDPYVGAKVTEARLLGVPVCLVGHTGWAEFAKRWLEDTGDDEGLLDLSKPHTVDVEKMIADIGDEVVPVLKKDYDPSNPIHAEIMVEKFLRKCWPSSEDQNKKPLRSLYLHQWQFPLSETAVPKLCGPGANVPLPNNILGDDLLRYWQDQEKCNQDSPYQYIFMGREGTMSNLHRDNGGLLITIAPIVGEKEVLLVHRADGPSIYTHNGTYADPSKPDLHRFPMLYSTRVWKSIIKPGEILLMPQGTYHQCRNVTPCLSYHRFYLDTVNLKAFMESILLRDAPEMEHENVVWNAAHELTDRVEAFVKEFRRAGLTSPVPADTVSHVEALRVLRHISRELTQRAEQLCDEEMAQNWEKLVHDIDYCLHAFRYRYSLRPPRFQSRRCRSSSIDRKQRSSTDDDDDSVADSSDEDQVCRVLNLKQHFKKLPRLDPEEMGTVLSDSVRLSIGDHVAIRLHGKRVLGHIVAMQDPMQAVMVHCEGFSTYHDEYQPLERLRIPVAGSETSSELCVRNLRMNMPVLWMDRGEEYSAVVLGWKKATFYCVSLELGEGDNEVTRWLTRDYVMEQLISVDSVIGPLTEESCAESSVGMILKPPTPPQSGGTSEVSVADVKSGTTIFAAEDDTKPSLASSRPEASAVGGEGKVTSVESIRMSRQHCRQL